MRTLTGSVFTGSRQTRRYLCVRVTLTTPGRKPEATLRRLQLYILCPLGAMMLFNECVLENMIFVAFL